VPIRLTPQPEDPEHLRRCLAACLWKILPAGLGKPNLPLLSRTVTILESLRKSDRLRLQEIYLTDFDRCEVALGVWLESLNALLKFCGATRFGGSVGNLNAFLHDMPPRLLDYVSPDLCLARLDFYNLGDYRHTAKKVASVLFNLVNHKWWKLENMEIWTLKFTKELVAWLD
jgi:hypothetical protein